MGNGIHASVVKGGVRANTGIKTEGTMQCWLLLLAHRILASIRLMAAAARCRGARARRNEETWVDGWMDGGMGEQMYS